VIYSFRHTTAIFKGTFIRSLLLKSRGMQVLPGSPAAAGAAAPSTDWLHTVTWRAWHSPSGFNCGALRLEWAILWNKLPVTGSAAVRQRMTAVAVAGFG
jgi:hypothetical protein